MAKRHRIGVDWDFHNAIRQLPGLNLKHLWLEFYSMYVLPTQLSGISKVIQIPLVIES